MSAIQLALAHVYLVKQEYSRCRNIIVEAFECLGWNLTLHKVVPELMERKTGVQETRVVEEMVQLLAVAHRELKVSKKNPNLRERVRGLARRIYVTLNGVEIGLEKIDPELGTSG